MDRARLSPGNCPCLSSGQTRLLQSGRPLERRPAPGMGLDSISARQLSCSGSRAGGSDAKRIARGTRATTEERNRFYAIDNCVCRSPCSGSRAGCINEKGRWKPPLLVRRRHARHYSVGSSESLTATASVKPSLKLKSPPLPQETVRWLPRASRSSTRLRK